MATASLSPSYDEVPLKVEYSISERGRTFTAVMDSMCGWGREHLEFLRAKEKVGEES